MLSKILLILFLFNICYINSSIIANCSRAESDIVRKFIDEKVIPAYRKVRVTVPEKCIWNKEHDIFGSQYVRINKVSDENWKCEYCNKEFYSESYIWEHMDNKHSDQLNQKANSMCLAQLCPILRCDIIGSRYNSKPPRTNWAQKLCNQDNMARLREKCHESIRDCVSVEMANYRVLEEYLQSVTCDLLTCENYWQTSKKSGSWAFNIYIGVTVFVLGLIVYYIALFVRLNGMDSSSYVAESQFSSSYQPAITKYRGQDLTYRGNRSVQRNQLS